MSAIKKPVGFLVCACLSAALFAGISGCAMLDAGGSASLNAAPESGSTAADTAYGTTEEPYSKEAPVPPDMQYPKNTEEYSALDEPGFVSTAAAPLSTFSADVDTASYCNLRRMVSEGMRAEDIPSGSVRIEEMLNYFDYDYALPENGDLFGVTSELANCPWNPDTQLLVMGFATEPVDYDRTAGANLVFLIDTSGSMGTPDKLPLLKDAFAELVGGLSERDRVSIVAYSGYERIVLEGASGTDKRAIMRAIDSLVADGSTNGEAGLAMAYHVAERMRIEGGVNRIVMASDGDLNVGISSESELHDYVSAQRDEGVYLSVLGFGSGNYKDNKMETLADNGNGTYHYIDCIDEARKVFGEDLAANVVPLADDVKVQVEFNPAYIKGYRLIGYENRALADDDFADDAADAGEIGTGHQFTIAYEIVAHDSALEIPTIELKYGDTGDAGSSGNGSSSRTDAELSNNSFVDDGTRESAETNGDALAESADELSGELLTCSVRYKPAGTSASVERSYPIDNTCFTENPSSDWTFAAAVIECGMVLRDSKHCGTASLREARALVDELDLKRSDPKADFERLLAKL
ncbi:vWA domain-containing protein [Raoultibacter phocaeensis]|uniref:vWA domain-containing protein n=1 Tax=Raoultibacter phocaeensis TaxID=2479841 RepID=UPI001119C39B|nr:VWA domain-containing protein [Raoultibacter phocaeensis]